MRLLSGWTHHKKRLVNVKISQEKSLKPKHRKKKSKKIIKGEMNGTISRHLIYK